MENESESSKITGKMADSTNHCRANIILPSKCPNNSHNGFGHTFLFPAVVEENQRGHCNASDLIKNCLRKSGLAYHSLESLQLHSCLFDYCFQSHGSGSEFGNSNAGFSSQDYFNAVLDEELGWFKYYKMMMPYIRLKLAVKIVTGLEEFCRSHLAVATPSHKQKTQVVLLITTALEMCFSIVFNLYQESQISHESEGDQGSDTAHSSDRSHSSSLPLHFQPRCEQFCHRLAKCLEILLSEVLWEENIKQSECNSIMTKGNGDPLRYFIEISSLTMMALNPFCGSPEIRDNLRQLLIGRVDLSSNSINSKKGGENSAKTGKQTRSTSFRAVSNVPKPKQVWVKHLVCTTNFPSEKIVNKARVKHEDMGNAVDFESISESGVAEANDCPLLFLNILRQTVLKKMFFRIVRYYSRGEDKIHKEFYNRLSNIMEDKCHVRVGDYFVNRLKLFSQVEELLKELTSRQESTNSSHSVALESGGDDLSTLLATLKIYPDRKQFNLSAAQEVLVSGRKLSGKDDLLLVKMALKEHIPGCYDLVTLGLHNSDFENWWNQGFLDLVLEKVEYLSTESSVQQVLCVLMGLSREEVICWESVTKMTGEQEVILDSSSGIERTTNISSALQTMEDCGYKGKDWLCGLKGREEVLRDATTLFNRLTCDNVHQLLPEVLVLCLYCKEAVVTQALQVAMDNKGQVEPIVMLLRHMPAVCNVRDPCSGGVLLMACFARIASNTQFNERTEENTVKLLDLLSQGYSRLLDSSPDICQWSQGVVSVQELVDSLILPALDRQVGNSPDTTDSNFPSLPITTVFNCFAALVKSTPLDKLHCLHGVVMVQFLAAYCVHHWSLFTTGADSGCGGGGGDVHGGDDDGACQKGGGSDAVWLSARICLDRLMDRLKAGDTLDSTSLDWLLEVAFHQDGLPCLIMVCPLLEPQARLQMVSVLELLLKEMTATLGQFSSGSALSVVLRLGQINDAICQTVTDFIGTNDVMLTIAMTRPQLISAIAELLNESSSSDIARTCCLLTRLISRHFVDKEEVDQDLVEFIDWTSLDRDCRVKCLCVQYLTDAVMWMGSSQETTARTLTVKVVINYQTACQTFLEGQTDPSSPRTGQEELLVYTFVQCCSLLCHKEISTMSKASQALHVLAMALLTHLNSALSGHDKGGRGKLTRRRDKDGGGLKVLNSNDSKCVPEEKNWKEDGLNIVCRNKGKEDVGCGIGIYDKNGCHSNSYSDKGTVFSDDKNEDGGEGESIEIEKKEVEEWLSLELLLSLRDVVMSIADDSIVKQLEQQLGKLWVVWVGGSGGGKH